ncbi:predicted protein [Arabidopsis lyrata subsp. lyrata]|uniref:non-specific serine/threonine protein kinase n=1 Tax=Arabidopsis lyrata subsp. lyrata TaxID=81972 RepID=D7KNW2_ARALL|nr:predicted protein [Arabidopsis lyrata subsp. lyrata]
MPRLILSFVLWFVLMSGLFHVVRPQNRTRATTDPDEARALNNIFRTWKITATKAWNISGELCSGAAIDDSVSIDNLAFNPLIKCDCSFVDSTICRIVALRARGMDVAGPIPEDLWTLVYISNLNLNQNFLTGPLSPGIGNLNRMQWMTFGANALSGPVPKEIGLLTDLRSLAIDMNNFSGSLPLEIGNCTRLVKMYIGSSGLSGEIPSSFANFVNLEEAWINDIQLTGQIPDFIGNWTKLTTLRILGTNLSGPIPSTFGNLISLTELRLGEISNINSSLQFIREMKSISVLVLRNNNLTGTIPSNIGDYLWLRQLDLSFNKLTGQIPAPLFNSRQLTHLFLGNNKLNGSLPTQKSPSLSNIDVSYNDLAGDLPSWVRLPNLQLNLIANHFTVGGSNRRAFRGLDCLQKNFRCNRGKGVYFNFFVNCGGPDIRSSSGALYEKDEGALGPATFFVSKTQRWAVSNVGLFTGSNSNQYIFVSPTRFANTSDSELFQSARLSASSLRYYGLGLENGGYSVTVQFAEIQIQGSNTWKSLGRRVFDIYVQGKLVEKDFDMHRTANGSSIRVIQRVYKANVSENYLEIHLFWAGKGTCCIPAQGTYGPLVSAISATPDFIPTVKNKLPSKSKKKIGIIVGAIVGAGMLSILVIAIILFIRRKRKRAADEEVLNSLHIRPYTFSYSELRTATQDFDPSNKLGEGGFGPVFKGKLNDGREIAVKQLSVASRQGKGQFVAEIATISAVQHRNLVKLYGCCIEGNQRMLVYEYLSNNSLDQALFEEKSLQLGWSDRFEICLGVAKGLAYMHEESNPRIVHRDVKASNILLDSDLVPKLSDFGLAKLYDDKKTHISTRVAGTIGYLSPEYVMLGHLTEKTDVFAFGIVALEVVSGRPNSSPELDDDKQYLLEWAWSLHQEKRDLELVDPDLTEFDKEEVKRVIGVAFLCTQTDHAIRPTMSRVVGMLTGDVEVTEANAKPGYVSERTFENAMSFMSGSTSSSWILPETPKDSSKSQDEEHGRRHMLKLRRYLCLLLTVWFLCNSGSVYVVRAQNRTVATTHPDEARALNSIFAAWRIRAPREWNISGELCSGAAIDASVQDSNPAYNPLIKCDCSFENSTICRITNIKVYAMEVVGPIPQQLWTLEYLTNLNLGQNVLTGSLPPAIGNLTRMQWMTFGINALSGPVPKEIGLLTNLKLLSISSNNFSGSIPDEIGRCTKLQQIYIDSSGLSGRIPVSFANLVELEQAWIADMELTGQIPDFIGDWTNLTTLRILGTGLSGPIPASFSNLTSLTELFLGNNTLNGSLPTQKRQSLSNIDVSYNDLSGSLPSWVSLPNLNLNLVANNFTLEGLDNRVLSGLNCLQKNFPCNRGKGIYSDFSINCGGPEIRSVTGALFEREDEDLGPASFVVSAGQRWGASSVGLFAGSSNNIYIATSQSQFVNTLDSELFQSARLSASSLRYYGLGLENGGYTVTLQFAEIQILGSTSNTWRGLGRRRFDIYVQGRLVEKDFDVRRTAGDSTVRAVQREYKANVSENHLEVHLFWAGKGTCCIPIQGAYGPLISAVGATPDFTPTVGNRPPSKGKSMTGTIVGVIVGVGLLSIFAGVVIFIIRKRRKRYTDDEEILSMDVKPYTFTYSELKSATQDFDPSNKLGEGGFGPVYKGKLNDGREIAVKLLSVGSRQGKGQFVAEIVAISAVQHRNLVKLYGCCYEGDHRLLVYEYLPNGSLDQALFGTHRNMIIDLCFCQPKSTHYVLVVGLNVAGEKTLHLDWSTRYEICLGVARGLVYLHEEARLRIVHRDVKASNILLDSKLVPKVSDFGLAKLYDDKKTHISTRVAGTIGYLAPEYAMRGHLTEKTDVYAFGVVALELVSGRPNSDENLEDEKRYLLEWAWNLHEKSREVELIDHELTDFNTEEAKRMIGIALLCTQTSHALRPPMSRVVAMLSGDVEVSDVTSKPGYLTDWRFDDTTGSSISGFRIKTTEASESFMSFVAPGSEISPRNNDSKPMLGAQMNEGR